MRPTLFIGLGTTGTNILIELRRMIYEEYGSPGLAILSSVAIETDQGKKAYDPRVPTPVNAPAHHKIDMIHATIQSCEGKKELLDPRSQQYHPGLKPWLDPIILEAQHFKDGAGHIRMAGRLCLWLNWEEVEGRLTNAINSIRAPENVKTTRKDLMEYWKRRRTDTPPTDMISKDPTVYIVGTFCGGTCGGMFYDLAYMVRGLLENAGVVPRVYGIFTILDKQLASDAKRQPQVANCFQSLWELDHYQQLDQFKRRYEIEPRVGVKPKPRTEAPFDNIQILSPSGNSWHNTIVDKDGEVRTDPLDFLVALNMFLDLDSNTGEQKKTIRSNLNSTFAWRSRPKNGKGHIQYFNSYGLSAIWFPRHKIINAAATLLARELIEAWIAPPGPGEAKIVRTEAEQFYDELKAEMKRGLELDERRLFLQNLETQRAELLTKSFSQLQARLLTSFPTESKNILGQLGDKGLIERKLNDESRAQQTRGREIIESQVEKLIASLASDSLRSIESATKFFQELDNLIQDDIGSRVDWPELDFTSDQRGIKTRQRWEQSARNIWTRALGLSHEAEQRHKEHYLDAYRGFILSRFDQIELYYLRTLWQQLRDKIGLTSESQLAHTQDLRPWQRLSELKSNLEQVRNHLKEDFEKYYQKIDNPCVHVLPHGETIKADAESLAARCRATIFDHYFKETVTKLLAHTGMTLYRLFNDEPRNTVDNLVSYFQKVCSETLGNQTRDMAKLARERLSDDELQPLLEDRSQPLMQFVTSETIVQNPNFIAGPVKDSVKNLVQSLHLRNLEIVESLLENFLICYRERPPFAIDQLGVYDQFQQVLKARKENAELKNPIETDIRKFPSPPPVDPEFYNWLEVALIFQDQLGIFTVDAMGRRLYRYKNPYDGLEQDFNPDPNGLSYTRFVELDSNRKRFVAEVKTACTQLGYTEFKQVIQSYLDNLRQELPLGPDDPQYDAKHKELAHRLQELFPDHMGENE